MTRWTPGRFFRFNGPFCLGEKSAAPKVATGAGWGAAHPGPAQPRPPGRCRPRGSSETMGNIWEIIVHELGDCSIQSPHD